jgi:hypothetical protein
MAALANDSPVLLASSPKMIVPHAVLRIGSQLDVPVTIVSVAPVARLIRCTPGAAVPCSLHLTRCVVFESFGQKAIMSVFAPEVVVTTPGEQGPWWRGHSALDRWLHVPPLLGHLLRYPSSASSRIRFAL